MSEETYSTAQIASLLNLTRAMINRYALAIEEYRGEKIKQTAKEGRIFSFDDYQAIANTKYLVDTEKITITKAVKMALGQAELASTASDAALAGMNTSQALEAIVGDNRAALEALVAANAANNELLLQEIRRLADKTPAVSSPVDESSQDSKQYSLLQVWVKKIFRV